MPQVGGSVLVSFLGSTVRGVIDSVEPDGQRLRVSTEDGERLSFVLNRATAMFTSEGALTGARLSFSERD